MKNPEPEGVSESHNSDDEAEKSSTGLFSPSGFWGFKDNIFSGISSRIEASWSRLNSIDNSEEIEKEPTPTPSTSSLQLRKTKDRSIYGQPEIPLQPCHGLHRSKDQSWESLDTLDSGQSMGGSSCVSTNELRNLELYDPLKTYRTAESIGIGSGQSTSVESSEAEESEDDHIQMKKSESQDSSKSWASSLSGDSQAEETNRISRCFMKKFVCKIFDKRYIK